MRFRVSPLKPALCAKYFEMRIFHPFGFNFLEAVWAWVTNVSCDFKNDHILGPFFSKFRLFVPTILDF